MGRRASFKQIDAKFQDALSAYRDSAKTQDLTPEKRAARRARCDDNDQAFAKEYFPAMFKRPFNQVADWMDSLLPGNYHCSASRETGKTAYGYIKYLIKPLALNVGGFVNLNTSDQELSDDLGADIVRAIFKNRKLVYDYDLVLNRDKAGHWIINDTHFITGSWRTGLRSIHALDLDSELVRIKYQLNDDIYGVTEAASEKVSMKIVRFIESEAWGQMDSNVPSWSMTLGNPITEISPIHYLRQTYPDNHFHLPALDNHGESTCPKFRPTKEWQAIAEKKAYSVWMAEYMCEPSIDGGNFGPEMINYINVNTIKIVASLSAADPAHGTSPESCNKAIATLGATSNREAVLLDIYLRKESYLQFFDYVDVLRGRAPAWKCLLFENDFAQWNFAKPYYDQWMKRTNKVLPIVMHKASQLKTATNAADKDSRIMGLIHPHITKQLLYSEALKEQREFKFYLLSLFGFGSPDAGKLDGPDSLATAYIMIWRYIETGTFEATKKRSWLRPRLFR